jgi:hypothetical protein
MLLQDLFETAQQPMNDAQQKRFIVLLNKKQRSPKEAAELRALKKMKAPPTTLVDGRWKLDKGPVNFHD